MRKGKIGTILLAVFTALIVGLTIFVCFNYHLAKDFIRSFSYEPTPLVSDLESRLKMTSRGDLIFKASSPMLEEASVFSSHCPSYNPGISVLGCYNNDVIYIYKVEAKELDGVIESTAAHEMLHAVWSRYNDADKSRLSPLLEEVYNQNKTTLAVIDTYEDSSRSDELFARIGTEIRNIPDELESAYAAFFTNRTNLVGYYEKYHGVFDQLANRIKTLSEEIDGLGKSIEAKTADYTTRSSALTAAVQEFNECANTSGCFTSADFVSSRAELTAEQNSLRGLYDEINAEVNDYNAKIAEYNQNALKTDYYNNMINSNVKE